MQVIKVSRGPNKEEEARESVRMLMQEVAQALVEQPEQVSVTYVAHERTTVYKIDCPKDSLGRLIGAKGKTIDGLRKVFAAITARSQFRSVIEIPYYEIEK